MEGIFWEGEGRVEKIEIDGWTQRKGEGGQGDQEARALL